MTRSPQDDDDARWMAVALRLGLRNRGRTWPNPAVGCVLVRDGLVVGRGWTASGGRPHAETEALARGAPLAAQGVEVVVIAAGADGHVDVRAAMQALGARGLTAVLVEGGAGIAAVLLDADLGDRRYLVQAGLVLGAAGVGAVGPMGIGALALAPRFRHITDHACGDDRLQLWAR